MENKLISQIFEKEVLLLTSLVQLIFLFYY